MSGPNAFSVYENASAVAFSDKKLEAGAMYTPWAKQSTRDMSRDNLLIDAAAYYSLDEENKLLLGAGYFAPGGNDLFQMDPSGNFIGDRVKPKYLSVQAGYARRYLLHGAYRLCWIMPTGTLALPVPLMLSVSTLE